MTISNPLAIPVQLYSCQLLCDHYGVDEELSTQGLPANPYPTEKGFTVNPIDILLSPKEIIEVCIYYYINDSKLLSFLFFKIELSVIPERIGLLEIRGIAFNIAGKVWCRKPFPIKKRKLQNTKHNRITGATEIDLNTSIQIVDSMPFLKIDFPTLPNVLYQGEVRQLTLRFSNLGADPLQNVAVKLSHPGLFVFGKEPLTPNSSDELHQNLNPFENSDENVKETSSPICDQYDLSIVHLPIEKLNPGDSVDIPLWVRGSKLGNQQCRFVFYYEPVETNKFIMYRVCREEIQFGVVPSLRASFWINPSIKKQGSYTLGIQFHSVQNNIGFQLLHASSSSSQWKIEPLSFNEAKDNS